MVQSLWITEITMAIPPESTRVMLAVIAMDQEIEISRALK
jgi:hypothetical protein